MNKLSYIGLLIIRVALGVTFLVHGIQKFTGGIGNISGWFESIHLPGIAAYLVAIVELLGGIAMILGLGTRVIGALFSIVMLVAIFKVKLALGFTGTNGSAGYEIDFALLSMSAAMALIGSPAYSIDRLFFGPMDARGTVRQ